jgi:hypothetical protein
MLQRRSSDAVAAQRRYIPKCPFFLPHGEKLVWRFSFFILFRAFAPIGLQKTNAASGGGVSANEYSCAHGAQINYGDLSPYLTSVHSN